MSNKESFTLPAQSLRLFGSARGLTLSALFIALSIVLGKYLAFTMGPFRVSFENLTVLLSGILFGPLGGLVVGAAADLVGCLLVGYAINPVVTLGAACVGACCGLGWQLFHRLHPTVRLALSVLLGHGIGSMLIKSIGLHLYFGFPLSVLWLRIPLYLMTGALEGYFLYLLLRRQVFGKRGAA